MLTEAELAKKYVERIKRMIDESREIARKERNPGWSCARFAPMVEKYGAVRATQILIGEKPTPPGPYFSVHRKRNLRHLTVEGVVAREPQWHPLFTTDEHGNYTTRLIEIADWRQEFAD
jgi:hypothetical protein